MPDSNGCLGVVHVPKSGGSALRAAVAQLPGSYSGPLYMDAHLLGSQEFVDDLRSPNRETVASPVDLKEIAESHRLVIGHYSGGNLMEAGCTGLAIQVREPRSRLLSLYRYWQAQTESVLASWGLWGTELLAKAHLPLRTFLASPKVWPAVDNGLVRQALADSRWPRSRRKRASTLTARYTAFVQYPLIVEWANNSQVFLERVCEQMGVPSVPSLGRENVTDVVGDEQRLDRSTMRLLDRLTQQDRVFVERLSADGLLRPRSRAELDEELEATATRLAFKVGRRRRVSISR